MKRIYTVGAGVVLAGLIYLFGWSPLLSAQSISVEGAPTKSSLELISSVSQVSVGDKMARIDPRAITSRLEKLNWIDSVSIHRNWISRKVTISVTTKKAIGIFNNLSIDAQGALFSLPGGSEVTLPHVFAKNRKDGLAAIELFTHLPDTFQENVMQLTAYNSVSFAMKLKEGSRVLSVAFGSARDIDLKVRVYQALIARSENATIKRIDLSAPHAPIVK